MGDRAKRRRRGEKMEGNLDGKRWRMKRWRKGKDG